MYTRPFYAAALHVVDALRATDAIKLHEEYMKSQWKPLEEIQATQLKMLRDLLDHAYANTGHYRAVFDSAKLKPSDIRSFEDLSLLPILEKETVQRAQPTLIAKNSPQFQPTRKTTGGSTGEPMSYLLDRQARSAHWASMYRQWSTGGWVPGELMVYLGGSSIFSKQTAIKKWIYGRLNNWLQLSAFEMNEVNMKDWLDQIQKTGARFMHAYASSAAMLAQFAESIDRRDIRLKSVFTSAEPLFAEQREIIQRVFNAEVFDLYGANDGGGFAFECEKHGGLHCVCERAIIEVVKENGSPAREWETGEVVTTDLLNYSMPFIRYRVGDIATVGSEPCSCGRGLPILRNVLGRSHDFVETSEGTKIHGEFFSHLLKSETWVRQYCVVQEENGDIVLNLKTAGNSLPPRAEFLRQVLCKTFKDSNVTINSTTTIPTPSSGKFRYVVNRSRDRKLGSTSLN